MKNTRNLYKNMACLRPNNVARTKSRRYIEKQSIKLETVLVNLAAAIYLFS